MALKVGNTDYFLIITKKIWKQIRWDKYNRFKKVKCQVAFNNLHI